MAYTQPSDASFGFPTRGGLGSNDAGMEIPPNQTAALQKPTAGPGETWPEYGGSSPSATGLPAATIGSIWNSTTMVGDIGDNPKVMSNTDTDSQE